MEVVPAVGLTSFSCPHCRALAHQFWWETYAARMKDGELPNPIAADRCSVLIHQIQNEASFDKEFKEKLIKETTAKSAGLILVEGKPENHYVTTVDNIWFSKCYACKKVALWRHSKLLFPAQHAAPKPNPDLPEDVLADYAEAGTILGLSPRGAAALLRLAIQKLMPHLQESGNNLNTDIGHLVAKGLDKKIQQALDIVRVIGNHAVHPGQIDLKDDQPTAMQLFELVNMIADAMISQPKRIEALYGRIPSTQLAAIERRDKSDKNE